MSDRLVLTIATVVLVATTLAILALFQDTDE